MRAETPETNTPLRSGYTTGACATATSLAAARLLLTGETTSVATIFLPRGEQVEFNLTDCRILSERQATASTIKDAGDDPDATHGATLFSRVVLSDAAGIRFHADEGVGTVTRAGLEIAVGEAAINPVPRRMMTEHLLQLAEENQYAGGFDVHVGIVDGERIALNTMNGRLGIVGGLSILGTTGIVRPFSCAAYIASIHQSIDVAHANGVSEIAASTGSTSEDYIQSLLGLPDMACVEMGDFAGAVLKHLRKVPMAKLSICGGFGKISKLAAGHASLHSKDSSIDFDFLASQAEYAGADRPLLKKMKQANTSIEAMQACQQSDIALADRICELAKREAKKMSRDKVMIDIYCVDRQGQCVGMSKTE